MEMRGSEILLHTLSRIGVKTIFGYPGGAILPIYDALHQQVDLKHILTRHEQGAVHAAEGYARSTGNVGTVFVTSGPGATNTITGLTDALMDSVPIVVISGQVYSKLIGTDAFQEADVTGITRACTKYNILVPSIEELEERIHEAYYIASTGRPGPVLVDIPKDIQEGTYSYQNLDYIPRKSYVIPNSVNHADIQSAIDLILAAKKPVILAGGGLVNSGVKACHLVTEFIERFNLPCTTTLLGLGAYSAKEANFLKMPGMHGSYEANMALHESDLLINIGARFDDRVTGNVAKFSPNSKKIHIDIDPSSINKIIDVDLALIGDASYILDQLLKEHDRRMKPQIDPKQTEDWWSTIEKWRSYNSFGYSQDRGLPKSQNVLTILNKLIEKEEFYVSTDVGQHQMWTAQYIDFPKPYRWLTSGGLGTMGYGLPAILGVQIAHPEKLCICVSGEASIMMNIQELSTITQYNLPVKIIILNNRFMGMVRQWQDMFYSERRSESYMDSIPDFVKLAESFGLTGLYCNDESEIEATLKKMIEIDGPVLLDMQTVQDENVYPMIPAGAGHNEILLNPKNKI